MNKGIIIHLDNDLHKILEPARTFFNQLGLPYEYIMCTKTDDLKETLRHRFSEVKCIIIDLLEKETDEELKDHKKSAFYESLQKIFSDINVPIFVYSGYIEDFKEFQHNGTVFKIDKGNEHGFKAVTDKIQLFHESGFLEIFCPNGFLEKTLHTDLHTAFVKQFTKETEIEAIINAIKASGQKIDIRTQEVFSRIALRSLFSSLMIDKTIEDEQFDEAKINAVELFVRRLNTDKTPIWTGDIFCSNKTKDTLIILTPRCDVASKAKENLLVCKVMEASDLKKGNAMDFVRDNIKYKKFRYLPSTPLFEGGKIDLSEYFTISKNQLRENYHYLISLTDDLTNEILGKLCAYFLRTSIPDVDEKELQAFLK